MNESPEWQMIDDFSLPSEAGNERRAMERVAQAIQGLDLPSRRLERLKTAVAEATMNAIEHGNHYQPDLPVAIQVLTSVGALAVRVTDQGSGTIPQPKTPNLAAKLAGEESPRGWGFFLIRELVDELHISSDAHHHTIELIVHLEADHGDSA
jgi:anti-sigma regulatory factor (Ser/Thr protein kinase)